MSEPEPRRPRFRLQTLVFVVVILGLCVGMVVQRWQYERQLAEDRKEALAQRARVPASLFRLTFISSGAEQDHVPVYEIRLVLCLRTRLNTV